MRRIILILALVGVVLNATVKNGAVQEFKKGNHKFAAAMHKEIVKENPGNLFVSPFSVEAILALVNEGAEGDTAEELVNGLYLPDTNEKVREAFKEVLPRVQVPSGKLKLLSANKIYLRQDAKLNENFASIAPAVYGSDVENVDFSSSAAVADEINNWVKEQTNSKMKDIVGPDSINENSVMVLVNTLYLTGKWLNMFNMYELRMNFYRTPDDLLEIYGYWQHGNLNYYENDELNAKFLELPLKESNISMVIALPNELDELAKLEEEIEKVLEPQPFTNQKVKLNLPKINVESEVQFVPILENLGIQKVFSTDAELSGISSTDKDIYVTEVIQKTYIKISPTGIFSYEGSDDFSFKLSDEPMADFYADRPFLYYIQNNGVILFTGRYVDPTK